MSAHPQAQSGEAQAIADIAASRSSKAAKVLLCGGFLLLIAAVALSNLRPLRQSWQHLATALIHGQGRTEGSPWQRLLQHNEAVLDALRAVDKAYDDQSPFCVALQPQVQAALCAIGEGGDEVLMGRAGWLFHRSGLRALTRDAGAAQGPQASASIRAIAELADFLKKRGIALVLLPMPPKLAVHPEALGRDLPAQVLEPAWWSAWKAQAQRAGAEVFDPLPLLRQWRKEQREALYLRTDTHWTAATMQRCAEALATHLQTHHGLVAKPDAAARTLAQKQTAHGDLQRMLRLPAGSTQFLPQEIPIAQVRNAEGLPWPMSNRGSLLLLGDSFCNIYSQASLGWGSGAGFAEHLGRALGQPINAMLRNGDGAFATRAMLSRALQTGDDRLEGCSVLVWEFDATQILEGQWKSLRYELGKAPPSSFLELAPKSRQRLIGSVVSLSPTPLPGSVAYRDFVGTLHLRGLRTAEGGALSATEVLAYGLAMQDNRLTALAQLRPGDEVEVELRPWAEKETEMGPLNRGEPQGDLFLQPIHWLDSLRPLPSEP